MFYSFLLVFLAQQVTTGTTILFIFGYAALSHLKGQHCQDKLLLVNGANSHVHVHQSLISTLNTHADSF